MRTALHKRPSKREGFTLVEIALSLAIIGFALVAIIGVLPKGLNAQRETREQTIINQDVPLWVEAVRQGAIGFDYLTNNVELLFVNDEVGPRYYSKSGTQPWPLPAGSTVRPLKDGFGIITRLMKPTYDIEPPFSLASPHTNVVTAVVRALTGGLVEQDALNPDTSFAFRYQITVEMVPFFFFANQATNGIAGFPPIAPGVLEDPALRRAEAAVLANHCYELRLKFEWPVINGHVGPNAKVYRTLVSGTFGTVGVGASGEQVRLFVPEVFAQGN